MRRGGNGTRGLEKKRNLINVTVRNQNRDPGSQVKLELIRTFTGHLLYAYPWVRHYEMKQNDLQSLWSESSLDCKWPYGSFWLRGGAKEDGSTLTGK